jgi:ParB-like chromosome segregation protein Spo0J
MEDEHDRDDVLDALGALAETLQETRALIGRALARVDLIHRQRAQGATYTEIVSKDDDLVVEMVTRMLRGLFEAGGRVRRAEAKVLSAEGLSMERIGQLFGVSRQRVSDLIRLPDHEAGAWWGVERRHTK